MKYIQYRANAIRSAIKQGKSNKYALHPNHLVDSTALGQLMREGFAAKHGPVYLLTAKALRIRLPYMEVVAN